MTVMATNVKMFIGEEAKTLDIFKTGNELKELDSFEVTSRPKSGSPNDSSEMSRSPTRSTKSTILSAAVVLREDTRRLYSFVRRHIGLHKNKSTHVKSIHIVQEVDDTIWAKRSVSASSRCSVETSSSTDSSNKGDGLEIVYDLDEESCCDS